MHTHYQTWFFIRINLATQQTLNRQHTVTRETCCNKSEPTAKPKQNRCAKPALGDMRSLMAGQAARCRETRPTDHTVTDKAFLQCAFFHARSRCPCARNAAHMYHIYTVYLQCGSSHEWSRCLSARNASRISHIYTASLQSGSSHACACGPSPRNAAHIRHTGTASKVGPLVRAHGALVRETLPT